MSQEGIAKPHSHSLFPDLRYEHLLPYRLPSCYCQQGLMPMKPLEDRFELPEPQNSEMK
jgi:hypothetical protein